MGETVSLFTTTFNRSLSVEARPEHLSSDAGAVLLREILEHSGLVAHLAAKLTDPRDPKLVTHPLADLLRTSLVLLGQGWRDQNDADALRPDPALRLAVSGCCGTTPLEADRHLPSQPTLSRLLETLSREAWNVAKVGRRNAEPKCRISWQPSHSSLPKRDFGTHFFRSVDELATIERISPEIRGRVAIPLQE